MIDGDLLDGDDFSGRAVFAAVDGAEGAGTDLGDDFEASVGVFGGERDGFDFVFVDEHFVDFYFAEEFVVDFTKLFENTRMNQSSKNSKNCVCFFEFY